MKNGQVITLGPEGLIWNEEKEAIIGELNGIRIILPKQEIKFQSFRWGISSFEEILQNILNEGFTAVVQYFDEDNVEATVSIKSLQRKAYQGIHVGEIYDGVIEKVGPCSMYVNINGIKVRVYIMDASRARVAQMQKIFHEGEPTKVKIYDKDSKFPYHVLGSRKDAYPGIKEESDKYKIGQMIFVTVCEKLNKDGFWIEVTPGIAGILNVNSFQSEKIQTGAKVIAEIREKNLRLGLKCYLIE